MRFKPCLLIISLGCYLIAAGQSGEVPIQSSADLASALYVEKDPQVIAALLRSHPQLIDNVLWTDLNEVAASTYYGPSPERSLAIYEIALKVAGLLSEPKLIAKTYYNIGRTYSALNQISQAIDAYEKSQQYFEQAGSQRDETYVFADLGALYFSQENYEKAKDYSQRSIAIADGVKSDMPPSEWPDDFGRARALQTLGEIDSLDGDHEKALEKLQSSLAIYQRLNGRTASYDFYIASVYAALGRVYPEVGDSSRALDYLNKALDIAIAQSNAHMAASLRNDIGFLYMEQEDYEQAKAQFTESLRTYASEKNQREEARVLSNLGVVEQRSANDDAAIRYFRLSLQAADAVTFVDVQVADYEGIGVVLTAKKNFGGAIEALNRALTIARTSGDKTRQSEILWRTAQVSYEMGDFTQSERLAENALLLARTAHRPKLTYLATTTLGQSYAAQKRVDLAIQILMQAVNGIESMREQVAGPEEERRLYFENTIAPYYTLVDLLVKHGKPLEALLYAERAKGRVLLDVLSNGKADLTKALTPGEKENAQRLNRNISDINDQIRKAGINHQASVEPLYVLLDAARLEYQSFQDTVYVAHPELNLRIGRTPTIDRAGVDALVRKTDSAYLEYVVSKERVYLFVLKVNKLTNETELKSYPLLITPQDLLRKVDDFHDRIANLHPDYTVIARELYGLLIAPAAEQLKGAGTLCIVPDGFLWNLPFQALMPVNDRYLIEDHAIYYGPSLSVLRAMANPEHVRRNTNSLIAFANPVIGKDEKLLVDLCPLPEAENEVGSIAKTLGPGGSKVFIGREASERAFKDLAPGFSVIHLATHGVIDNRNPLYSHLLLTRTEGDVENDGLLEAREIMNLKLNADLVVLSACETANGKIAPGEGVMGMSWAFFLSGSRSMLISQWKVNSASTSQLMANFYQNLSNRNPSSGTKARALQAGTLRLMRDDRLRHPFFWAGFVLAGVN